MSEQEQRTQNGRFVVASRRGNVRIRPTTMTSPAIEDRDVGGCKGMKRGEGFPAIFEWYEGKPWLYVWADINTEDFTHAIDLSGAMESERLPEDNDDDQPT